MDLSWLRSLTKPSANLFNPVSVEVTVIKPTLTAVCCYLLIGAQLTEKPYALKGETPGTTTVKEFKHNHKTQHVECSSQVPRITHCRVFYDVSFAGAVAHTFKGCGDVECDNQGIFATFNDGVLVELRYGVAPFQDDVVFAALKEKFGEPTSREGSTDTWKNSTGTLTLTTWRDINSPRFVGLMITSRLNNTSLSNDI